MAMRLVDVRTFAGSLYSLMSGLHRAATISRFVFGDVCEGELSVYQFGDGENVLRECACKADRACSDHGNFDWHKILIIRWMDFEIRHALVASSCRFFP